MKTKIDKNATKEAPSRKGFAPGTLTAPLPPALVTVGEGESANVLTVAWTGILASTPPKTYVSIRPSRHSYKILKETGQFVLHLPSADQARAVDYAGIFTGAKVNKFEKCGFEKTESETVAPPTIAGCPLALECRVTEVIPMGSHDVFMADILRITCHETLLDEKGKIHMEKANLLAYAHGEYYTLGKRVGAFGFSAAKKKKRPPKSVKK
ncbi:MAG: flavin reductase family protein [Clostridia bacterium]|nr:flavin reductase family protein [Clostridia bacterium]